MASAFPHCLVSREKLAAHTLAIRGIRESTIPLRRLANERRARSALQCFQASTPNTSRRLPDCWEPSSAVVSHSPLLEANNETCNLAADPVHARCFVGLSCSTPALSPRAIGDCGTSGDKSPPGRQSTFESGN